MRTATVLLLLVERLECNIQVIGPVRCKELLVKAVLVHHCRSASVASAERTETKTTEFQADQEDRVMALVLIAT